MKLKTLSIAVGVLAALSALAFWYNRPPPPASTDPYVGRPLFDASLLDGSAGLRISDQGKSIELSHGPDGAWTVKSYYGLPADFAKLSSFVNDLTSSKIQRFVTANPERLARLEFKGTRIEVLDDSGKPTLSVALGKNADGGGRFVGFGDLSRAYLSSFNAWLDTEPKAWADATLTSVKLDDVASIEVAFDDDPPVLLSRAKKDAPWMSDRTPKGQRVKADAVSNLVGTLGTLRFSETSAHSDPGVAAAWKHSRTIEFTEFSGPTVTITLGRTPEEKKLKPPAALPRQSESKPGLPRQSESKPGLPRQSESKPGPAPNPSPAPKAAPPEYETIPAGPVYALVLDSNPKAAVNALMRKRACQIDEYTFTSLPQKAADLFEPAPTASTPAH